MSLRRRDVVGGAVLGAAGVALASSFRKAELAAATGSARPSSLPMPIGINLAPIADWEPGFPFRNLMWGARSWETKNADGRGEWNTNKIDLFEFDENGYPLEVPLKGPAGGTPQAVFTTVPNVRKPGRYVLLHEGEGRFASLMGTRVLSERPGRVLLEMRHEADLTEGIILKSSRRGNHVRNIRIVSLEDEKVDLKANPFLPEFLEFCRPFHCLRFMDWGATNGSLEEKWADRRKPTFYTMVGAGGNPDGDSPPTAFQRMYAGGVAIEIMLQLANTLGIDPWICVPHRADDDYIAQLARLTRERLRPELKVYVEYSNEIWNWGFPQSQWMLQSQLAGRLVEAKGGKAWDDAAKTKGSDHPERIGALFRRNFAIWEREWRPSPQRLRRVCAVQAAWHDASDRTARWCAQHGGADLLSPAGYFGPDDEVFGRWEKKGGALSAEDVLADMDAVIDREHQGLAEQVKIANKYRLGYVSYEGGQHIQPRNQVDAPYSPALAKAQSHPRMYDLYVKLLRKQRALGCELFCHFSSVSGQGTRWGSWGAKGSYAQPLSESPKLRALLDSNLSKSNAGAGRAAP